MSLLVLIGSLLLGIIIGLPVAFAIGFASVLYILVENLSLVVVPQVIANGLDSYTVIAIPFFILAAQIMNRGGITEKLMAFADTLVGRFRGGLGHVNILTSMLFSGMSGSAVADSAGLGKILIPTMKRRGYTAGYSAAVTAASSTIGPIIPPSVPIVIYGILAEVSIGGLFLAGAVPGVVLGGALLILNAVLTKFHGFPAGRAASIREIIRAFIAAIPPLLTPVILLGGMWAGVFSPTEAAAVAVGYAVLQGTIFGDLTLKILWDSLREAAIYSGLIMIIVACATLFGYILTTEQIPVAFGNWLVGITQDPVVLLLIINIFLLLLGCFMEILSVILMTVPILLPVVVQFGINPIHFGVIMVLNLMIGLLTPPFGLSLYIAQDIAEIPYSKAVKAILPFLAVIIAVLALVTYVPSLSMFLIDLSS